VQEKDCVSDAVRDIESHQEQALVRLVEVGKFLERCCRGGREGGSENTCPLPWLVLDTKDLGAAQVAGASLPLAPGVRQAFSHPMHLLRVDGGQGMTCATATKALHSLCAQVSCATPPPLPSPRMQ
jgi:hypothetical protein